MQNSLNLEGVEQQALKDYTEQAYLDYSMYVILDRALPQIGDGLAWDQNALRSVQAFFPLFRRLRIGSFPLLERPYRGF